ncbi:RloB family protein [Frisingicoccus sp.]|uniref:RloB family protein n=1 Tax=Frisingicoccus sp. TaxID=1918627 RepID=UPI003AB12504
MSLKPKKHSDQKKIQAKMKQHESKMATKYQLPPYTLIVSEGIKTEPLYLEGFVRKINAQYKGLVKDNHIIIWGTGRNTKGLLKLVDKKVENGEWSHFEKIWLVYDKDDFPFDNFDNTQFSAEGRKDSNIRVAWSNESFELWLLLHFQEYVSDNGRQQYIEKLNTFFQYSKAREDLFDVIMKKGSLKDAKRRAKKLYNGFLKKGEKSPSKMVPATKVYELVEELESYIH